MYGFLTIFLMFILYSIIGYLTEITFCTIHSGKIVWNRGFLIGPWLPIYGYGAMIIIFMLDRYKADPLTLFLLSTFYCTLLEYLTSYLLEKVFKLRWWDYSEKKFNINGRVCLSNGFLFGLCGLLIIEVVNPIITSFVYSIPNIFLYIISILLFIIYLIDTVVSSYIAFGVKKTVKKISKEDATDQIKKEVVEFLQSHNLLTGRLLKSFPNMNKINGKRFEKFTITYNNVRSELSKVKLAKRHK